MRQLYESDRKLRAFSLVKYSKLLLQDIDKATKAMMTDRVAIDVTVKADSIAAYLRINSFLDQNDAAVTAAALLLKETNVIHAKRRLLLQLTLELTMK